jgi:hypothetical protein
MKGRRLSFLATNWRGTFAGEALNTPNELCPALVSSLTVQHCGELRCSAAGFLIFCPF